MENSVSKINGSLPSMINSEEYLYRVTGQLLQEEMLNKAIWFILVLIMRKEVLLVLKIQNGNQRFITAVQPIPVTNFTLLTVNYYDEYPPGSPAAFNGASVLGSSPVKWKKYKGLPVASMVKNIEDNGWTKSYTWYDDKSKEPCSHRISGTILGFTRTSSVLAFSGVPTSTNNLS